MNAEQLTAKIEANPCLAPYFQDWAADARICPRCVKIAVGLKDQQEFEKLIKALIDAADTFDRAKAELEEATRAPQQKFEEARVNYRAIERRLLICLGWPVSDPSDR